MKRSELTLAIGGLMRCCTQSLSEWIDNAPDAEVHPGENLSCKYENKETMVIDDHGVVRWNNGVAVVNRS